MGSAELEAALRRQGAESALALVNAARERATSRSAELDAAWEERRQSALRSAEAEIEAQTTSDLIGARRDARKLMLEARHRAIERVLAAVPPRLRGLPARRELEDLRAFLPEQEVVIVEASDGLLIEAQDGSAVVDGTLTQRLEQLRPLLAIRILELIDAEAP